MNDLPIKKLSNRYQLKELIGSGGMGAVYRAYDRLTKRDIALKRVILKSRDPHANEKSVARMALANEFRVVAGLRHPNIISVYDYGFDDERQPFFTMTLLEGAKDIRQASQGRSVTTIVDFLIEMLQALTYLHRHGIVHRDMKPNNVLISAKNEVKVLDFGLASTIDVQQSLGGTLSYMAPETLQSEQTSFVSDLYSVGVIGYELLTGMHPFDKGDFISLVRNILEGKIDFERLPDTRLIPIFEQLLAFDPAHRFPDAFSAIEALCWAMDRPLPDESRTIRESFLQASRFVGRQDEYQQLNQALENVLQGSGSAWLVGGESGVGKSRLLEEIRTHALTQGIQVLWGQAIENGGIPYLVWRDILRHLALDTPLSPFEIAVLKDVVLDIDSLLGVTIPAIPILSDEPWQQRFINTMMDVFKRQTQPLLLILEDLQWSKASLEALKQLLLFVEELPIVLIGSYRTEEAPQLPEKLKGMQTIRLERLAEPEVAALSMAMLGSSGENPNLVDMLNRETEGNVFFLTEVIRALAEDAGRLNEVGRTTLPEQLFVGGFQRVIRRRLERVPEWGQPLLKVAALMGRQLDLEALRQIEPDLDRWLLVCSNYGVLEAREQGWRFAHDKLREALLADMDGSERQQYAGMAAQAIASIHQTNPQYGTLLADLWHDAGEYEAMILATMQASEYMCLITAAYAEAGRILHRAIPIAENIPALAKYRVHLYRWYGASQEGLGLSADAEDYFTRALSLAREQGELRLLMDALRGYTQTLMRQGKFKQAEASAEEGLSLAREQADGYYIGMALASIGVIAYYAGEYERSRQSYEEALQYLKNEDATRIIARTNVNLAVLIQSAGDYETALSYLERGLAVFQEAGILGDSANTLLNIGYNYSARGLHQTAMEYDWRAYELYQSFGDKTGMAMSVYNIAAILDQLGELEKAEKYLQDSLSIRRMTQDKRGMLFSLDGLSENAITQGKLTQARAYLQEAFQLANEMNLPSLQYKLFLAFSKYLWKVGDSRGCVLLIGALKHRPQRAASFDVELQNFTNMVQTALGDVFDEYYQAGEQLSLADTLAEIDRWLA